MSRAAEIFRPGSDRGLGVLQIWPPDAPTSVLDVTHNVYYVKRQVMPWMFMSCLSH